MAHDDVGVLGVVDPAVAERIPPGQCVVAAVNKVDLVKHQLELLPFLERLQKERDYTVDERFEAGIQLRGTEVKSIRAGKAQINDAFARVEKGELWLHNAHIEQYAFGNIHNHDAKRIRKLLLHRRHIDKIRVALESGGGRAVVPLRMYFKDALVKAEVALATGKKLYDRRESLKTREAGREMERAIKGRKRDE